MGGPFCARGRILCKCASDQSAVRCADRQLDAGGEMASQWQHELGASKWQSKEARALLEGGYVLEIKRKRKTLWHKHTSC